MLIAWNSVQSLVVACVRLSNRSKLQRLFPYSFFFFTNHVFSQTLKHLQCINVCVSAVTRSGDDCVESYGVDQEEQGLTAPRAGGGVCGSAAG